MQKLTPVQWLLVAVGAIAVMAIVGLSYYLGVLTQKPLGQSVQVVPTITPVQNVSPTEIAPTATPIISSTQAAPTATPTPVPKTGTPVHILVPN